MFSFPYVDSDLAYWYIIWKFNTETGKWIWKTHFALCLWVAVGDDFMHSLSSFLIFLLHVDAVIIGIH